MTIFLKMAWRNIRRNLRRTVITLSAITFGLAAMIIFFGFINGWTAQGVDNTVRAYTGHIEIFRSGYREDPQLNKSITNIEEVLREIEKEPALSAYTYRLEMDGLISTAENSYGVLIRGIDPEQEIKVTAIRKRIIAGEYLGKEDGKGVLIGDRLARRLNAATGDKVVLMAQGAEGSFNAELFRIKGIFRMGIIPFDSATAIINLKEARMLAAVGESVTEVALMVDRPGSVLPAAERLKKRLSPSGYAVYSWEELLPAVKELIEFDNIFMYIILLIVIVVVALGILNTMLMSIIERTREFGIMTALGTSPNQVVLLVMLESIFIGMIGILLGAVIGIGANDIIAIKGIDLSRWAGSLEIFATVDPVIYPETKIWNVLWSSGAVLLTAMIVAIYPAIRAARLRPVEAMQ